MCFDLSRDARAAIACRSRSMCFPLKCCDLQLSCSSSGELISLISYLPMYNLIITLVAALSLACLQGTKDVKSHFTAHHSLKLAYSAICLTFGCQHKAGNNDYIQETVCYSRHRKSHYKKEQS